MIVSNSDDSTLDDPGLECRRIMALKVKRCKLNQDKFVLPSHHNMDIGTSIFSNQVEVKYWSRSVCTKYQGLSPQAGYQVSSISLSE